MIFIVFNKLKKQRMIKLGLKFATITISKFNANIIFPVNLHQVVCEEENQK